MGNSLFNVFGGQSGSNMPPMFNMISKFNQFKNSFQGDARQEVQNLLNSGQMSQQQFNQLQSMAQQFSQLLK